VKYSDIVMFKNSDMVIVNQFYVQYLPFYNLAIIRRNHTYKQVTWCNHVINNNRSEQKRKELLQRNSEYRQFIPRSLVLVYNKTDDKKL